MTSLAIQIESALAGPDWSIHHDQKRMRDELGQVYRVTALTLIKGATRLLLDPISYGFPGADAAVDLFLLPPYDPVASFYLESGTWFLHSAFPGHQDHLARPTDWARNPLNPEGIRSVLESIAQDAVPSV